MLTVNETPSLDMENFELIHAVKAYDRIPVTEYVSRKTGLTVVIAEVEGPVVHGLFGLATEALDDDGLPHTLEHLIFLGSEDYPYKGILDLLSYRCLASNTKAWTNTDHTRYSMETVGSEGFLTLMPIFLEHILYPVLTEEGFITEVHHITSEGTDAGVVYCEIQDTENSSVSRMHLNVVRNIYPGKCGYSFETKGIMKNLRKSTNNRKVKNYHKKFYRPENLKIIITGQVHPHEVFKALEKLEEKIISKKSSEPFQRPWQNPVPPMMGGSKDLILKYPNVSETSGLYWIAWRGPCITDLYSVTAIHLLLNYLAELSVSYLSKEFVNVKDPHARKILYDVIRYSVTCINITLIDVPVKKLAEVGTKLKKLLQNILEEKSIDIDQLRSIINKSRMEKLSQLENNPHNEIGMMILQYMLYGSTGQDLQQQFNPLTILSKLYEEPQFFWLNILRNYLVDNEYVAIQGVPSVVELVKMTMQEKQRIEVLKATLTPEGLKKQGEILEKAIEFINRKPPVEMLTGVAIPSITSIKFHAIERFSSNSGDKRKLDLSRTSVFTYFDHLKTSFVYLIVVLDSSTVPPELRMYLPLLFKSLLELPLKRDGKIIPYDAVVAQLNDDTVSSSTSIGVGDSNFFVCGKYSTTCTVTLQVEAARYETGVRWLRELLYKTVFTAERLKVFALNLNRSAEQLKQMELMVADNTIKDIWYSQDSNMRTCGVLLQHKFLTDIIERLDGNGSEKVVADIEKLRKIITDPSNLALYVASNLNLLKNASKPLETFLPVEMKVTKKQRKMKVTPDHKLRVEMDNCVNGYIICMNNLPYTQTFCIQTTKSIYSYTDPDLPALMVYLRYLIQKGGPIYEQMEGTVTIVNKIGEGLLYLYSGAANCIMSYENTKNIILKQQKQKAWDETFLEAAKSSTIYEMVNEESTIGRVVWQSFRSYFDGVDYEFIRGFWKSINEVSIEDLIRVGAKYVTPLFDPKKAKIAIVTDASKSEKIAADFEKFDLELPVYSLL